MSQKRNNLFENESLKMLLEEFTGEQQTNNKTLDDLVKSVNQLRGKVSQIEQKLANPEPVRVTVNSDSVQNIVKEGRDRYHAVIVGGKAPPFGAKIPDIAVPRAGC